MKKIFLFLVIWLFVTSNLFGGSPNLSDSCYGKSLNPFTKSGYGGQCTAFVWGRACEQMNISLEFKRKPYPSAKYWYEYGPKDYLNLKLGKIPKANSIAIWEGDSTNVYGHVAYVEKVKNGYVYFNEANINTYNGTKYGGGYDGYEKKYSISNFEKRGKGVGKLKGYIYLQDDQSSNQQGWVDLKGDISISPSPVVIDEEFKISFTLKEDRSSKKKFEYIELWIHDKYNYQNPYLVKRWENISFSANKSRNFYEKTSLYSSKGRTAGKYKVIIKGKVKNDTEFNFGVKEFEAKAPIQNNIKPYAYIDLFQDGRYGDIVIFDAYYSYDSDGSIVKYEWSEGSTVLSTNSSFSGDFSAGTHTVTLKVTDNDGATATDSVTFTVLSENGSNTTTKNTQYYLDKFYNTYAYFFGNKSGSVYTCYTEYLCQDFNTGTKIAVHKSSYDIYFYYDDWYYYGKGSQTY